VQRKQPRFGRADAIMLAVLLPAVVAGGWWIAVGYDYNWRWAQVPSKIVHRTAQGHLQAGPLLNGLIVTIRVSIWTTVLALVLGLVMALMRLSRTLFWRLVSGTYVQTVRNLPPLVLVLFMYYLVFNFINTRTGLVVGIQDWAGGLGQPARSAVQALFGRPEYLGRILCAVVTLGLYQGAYMTEIIRSGVESIPRGQFEAAHALGLSRLQELRHVILPQALRNVLPALTGQFISAIKASAIVSLIAVPELTFKGDEVAASVRLGMEMWISVAAMYLLLTLSCSVAFHALEKRLTRHRA
jgi:polar amino acid transport system permease protein